MPDCPDIIEIETRPVPEAIEVGVPGPPGPPGTPAGGESGAYLQAGLRLAEFNTPEAKAAARANLELQNIDGGTFN